MNTEFKPNETSISRLKKVIALIHENDSTTIIDHSIEIGEQDQCRRDTNADTGPTQMQVQCGRRSNADTGLLRTD